MLVLSRREHDKIVFPHLGITVEVVRIAGSNVRIGVQAPPHVAVLRHELVDQQTAGGEDPARKVRHELRNHLNVASLCLHLAQKQLATGQGAVAEKTLEKALDKLAELDRQIAAVCRSPAALPMPLAAPMPPQHAPRALLVDDDNNESELLAGFLRLSGFEVDTAYDGCDALEYLSGKQRPDVVLLDMLMPRCDGPSTIRAIRRDPGLEGLKVIAVSGTEPGELGVTVGPQGVDYWFAKPVNPQRLVAEINRRLVDTAKAG